MNNEMKQPATDQKLSAEQTSLLRGKCNAVPDPVFADPFGKEATNHTVAEETMLIGI